MKRRIRLTEGELKRIVSESVKRILKESQNFVMEDETLITDDKIFGDSNEHAYDMKCYDGWAIGRPSSWEDEKAPSKIRMKYPKLDKVLANKKLANYVLDYRGLHDLGPEDITYGDIMFALGEIEGVETERTAEMGRRLDRVMKPPKGFGIRR